MAVQKLNFLFIITIVFLFISCMGVNSSEPTDAVPPTNDNTMVLSKDKKNILMTCFDKINITIKDNVLIYWAEVASNDNSLNEHAGNERVVIMEDGSFYYSNNDGKLENFNSYFNTDLKQHKILSEPALNALKKALNNLKLEDQPDFITNPDIQLNGGYHGYFYFKNTPESICKKIDMSVGTYKEIKSLLHQ